MAKPLRGTASAEAAVRQLPAKETGCGLKKEFRFVFQPALSVVRILCAVFCAQNVCKHCPPHIGKEHSVPSPGGQSVLRKR